MRVAIAKPDYRIVGGFEKVLDHVEAALVASGHEVSWLRIDLPGLGRSPFGVPIPDAIWEASSEFFRYANAAEAFAHLDARSFDLVLSTQPPSYAVAHRRHVSLFYHHHRVFYDLSDVYLAAGFAEAGNHLRAQAAVRSIDSLLFSGVSHFLTPSSEVQDRLRRFQGVSATSPFQAGIGFSPGLVASTPSSDFSYSLCVSRHEFPKRTELFVQALKYLPEQRGVLVGSGGRLPWVKHLDHVLGSSESELTSRTPEELWLCRAEVNGPIEADAESNVAFMEHVPHDELARLYGSASCVVAPAYLEDYGLTALEAMAFGKPVIVCRDGGGLTELVGDGKTGFVVEPTGAAIADAVRRLAEDGEMARELGANGRQAVGDLTWEAAARQLVSGLEAVAG